MASSASWVEVGDAVGVADAQRLLASPGGGSIFQEWARMPSRTSQVRLRSSSTSKMRTLCAAWCQPPVVGKYGRERLLAGVPEGRVADVVAERDRLGERLVERQRGGQRPRDLGHLDGVRQARDVVVALGVDEDLRLVLEPPEGLASG